MKAKLLSMVVFFNVLLFACTKNNEAEVLPNKTCKISLVQEFNAAGKLYQYKKTSYSSLFEIDSVFQIDQSGNFKCTFVYKNELNAKGKVIKSYETLNNTSNSYDLFEYYDDGVTLKRKENWSFGARNLFSAYNENGNVIFAQSGIRSWDSYTYDSKNNIIKRESNGPLTVGLNSYEYQYDDQNRITSCKKNGTLWYSVNYLSNDEYIFNSIDMIYGDVKVPAKLYFKKEYLDNKIDYNLMSSIDGQNYKISDTYLFYSKNKLKSYLSFPDVYIIYGNNTLIWNPNILGKSGFYKRSYNMDGLIESKGGSDNYITKYSYLCN